MARRAGGIALRKRRLVADRVRRPFPRHPLGRLLPETVATRETPEFHWAASSATGEASAFPARRAHGDRHPAAVVPADVDLLLERPGPRQETFVLGTHPRSARTVTVTCRSTVHDQGSACRTGCTHSRSSACDPRHVPGDPRVDERDLHLGDSSATRSSSTGSSDSRSPDHALATTTESAADIFAWLHRARRPALDDNILTVDWDRYGLGDRAVHEVEALYRPFFLHTLLTCPFDAAHVAALSLMFSQ